MAKNEKTSTTIGSLASKAMRKPEKMSKKEIKSLGASALAQVPDTKKPVVKRKPAKKKG